MTAIVLPEIDRSTIDELKKRIPDLTELDLNLPTRKEVGRTADQAIDRLLGRRRAPVWPWIAAGIGVAAIIGIVAAWFAWFRRPSWQGEESSARSASGSPGGPDTSEMWPTTESALGGSIDDGRTSIEEA